ncbi:DMT family transporter [Neobacillus cucumis]|nr:DMT family transporter [Neobacillus cucumis]
MMIRNYLLLLFCVTCWGSNFIFGAILVKEFSPMLLSALRLFFIAIFIALYALKCKKWRRIAQKDWLFFILLGLVGVFINHWTFYAALETADSTTSAIILALAPITTALLSSVFLGEKLTLNLSIGMIIAFMGVFFVITNGEHLHFSIGIVWIFITMLSFSISMIMVKKLTERYHSITITVYSTIIGFSSLAPVALTTESPLKMSRDYGPWILLIITAILMHGVCTLIWNSQIEKVGASKASLFMNLEPFIAMIVGLIVLKNNITRSQILGSILIIIGVLIATQLKDKLVMKENSLVNFQENVDVTKNLKRHKREY